jgi:hypothetical protein
MPSLTRTTLSLLVAAGYDRVWAFTLQYSATREALEGII